MCHWAYSLLNNRQINDFHNKTIDAKPNTTPPIICSHSSAHFTLENPRENRSNLREGRGYTPRSKIYNRACTTWNVAVQLMPNQISPHLSFPVIQVHILRMKIVEKLDQICNPWGRGGGYTSRSKIYSRACTTWNVTRTNWKPLTFQNWNLKAKKKKNEMSINFKYEQITRQLKLRLSAHNINIVRYNLFTSPNHISPGVKCKCCNLFLEPIASDVTTLAFHMRLKLYDQQTCFSLWQTLLTMVNN